MELRKLTAADAAQVRAVWKECFNDSDAFLDAYFESAASVEDGIGFFDGNGKLLSDLFMLNLNAQIGGMVYPSRFLAGCATIPEARNQHLMRDLLLAAMRQMSSDGLCVTFLHPFLHSFYRKFGYETISYVRPGTYAPQQGGADSGVRIATKATDVPASALLASYMDYVSQYGSYFMRTQKRMDAWLALLFSDGGKAAFLEDDDNTPYALYYDGTDSDGNPVARVFELVCFSDGQRQALLGAIGGNVDYFTPTVATDREADEFTMMRVLRPDIMLQSYQYPKGTKPFVINIHDAFLGNDYNLRVTPTTSGTKTESVNMESDIVTGITDFARLITGAFAPADFPTAAEIFSSGSSCYFETY